MRKHLRTGPLSSTTPNSVRAASHSGSGPCYCYSYLWHRERRAGREEGVKDRPCAIVAAIQDEGHGTDRRVLVLPVTHAPPNNPNHAVEIPALIKRQLKLDDAPSWVVVTEWNEFVWPGSDLRRLPETTSFAYGILPRNFFNAIRNRFLANAAEGAASESGAGLGRTTTSLLAVAKI